MATENTSPVDQHLVSVIVDALESWSLTSAPVITARTVLGAIPDGWAKFDGEWRNLFDIALPMEALQAEIERRR